MSTQSNIPFVPEKAVFPLELLSRVAEVQRLRRVRPQDHGAKRRVHKYPLSVVTTCAECWRQAIASSDFSLVSHLTGSYANGVYRYIHTPEIRCACCNKSVHSNLYEDQFGLLLEQLAVRPEALVSMTRLAREIDEANLRVQKSANLKAKRQQDLALYYRRLEANSLRFGAGEIEQREWQATRTDLLQRIKTLEEQEHEPEQVYLELKTCLATLHNLVQVWKQSRDDERQQLVRSLFAEVVYAWISNV